jgi:regulator of protease activity HflC (stomatin/prohibitin superfamily)
VGNVNTIKTRIIDPTIQEVMKASTARYTAEELITKRQAVSDDTIAELQDRL